MAVRGTGIRGFGFFERVYEIVDSLLMEKLWLFFVQFFEFGRDGLEINKQNVDHSIRVFVIVNAELDRKSEVFYSPDPHRWAGGEGRVFVASKPRIDSSAKLIKRV